MDQKVGRKSMYIVIQISEWEALRKHGNVGLMTESRTTRSTTTSPSDHIMHGGADKRSKTEESRGIGPGYSYLE